MAGASCTTSPTDTSKLNPALVNLLNETNTYDKLHQRFNTLGQQQQQMVGTLNSNQQNQLINKYIQNLNRQLLQQSTLQASQQYSQSQVAESTPFLIIQNMSDMNRIVNGVGCGQEMEAGGDTYQHTYHEIGEVLLNGKMGRVANCGGFSNGVGVQRQQGGGDRSEINNELFI